MNITLARTFIEIVNAGSFVTAANRLNVTQSTVSTRIQALENELGRRLFIRNKAGATLTPAGDQFQRYAMTLTQVWEQACHHIAVPEGYRAVLAVGGQVSLWDGLLTRWLPWIQTKAPDISIRAEYGQPDRLMIRLIEGILDIGVMYTPQSRPGLKVELLFEEQLVSVTAEPPAGKSSQQDYVYIDWGPEFRANFSLNYPQYSNPALFLALGSHGLQYILDNGGSGHFPMRVVRPFLDTGQLTLIEDAPKFSLPAYVVYGEHGDEELLNLALEGLRKIVTNEIGH